MKPRKHIRKTMNFAMMSIMIMLLLISCNGCRSGRVQKPTISTMPNLVPDTCQIVVVKDTVRTSLSMDSIDYYLRIYEQSKNISLLPADDSMVDEYNVRKYLLEFRNPETREVIKTIDLVKENPFHKMGLKRRKEPYPAVYYFLMPEGAANRNALRKFLPQETFHEIPVNFEMDRAISKIFVSTTANKYVTVSYELDWLPDAYSDEGEWDGPGYGVHLAVVYDSIGNKLYTRQFDGTSTRPSVSEDGKYLFTMACLSPEWDENIRYRFTVVEMQTGKVVFEELIENCKKNGGAGDFDDRRLEGNYYVITLKSNFLKKFLYIKGNLYNQKTFMLIDNIFPISNHKIEVWHLNAQNEILNIDSLFTKLNLN